MEEMSSVVQAMLKRLEVDLSRDEVALALQVFHVPLWGDAARRQELRQHAQALCKVLGLQCKGAGSVLGTVGQKLHSMRQAAKNQGGSVSNRQAWSWVLDPVWRAQHTPRLQWQPEYEELVCFYLAVKINTTTVERNLGELLQQLNAHSGPLAESGASLASILEVAGDGPQKECEFFLPPLEEGGALVPTAFGVKCGQLWLEHFGRRFRRTYYCGSDAGGETNKTGPRPKNRGHKPGSLAAIVAGRKSAASALVSAAKEASRKRQTWQPASFVPSLSLPVKAQPQSTCLAGTRWGSAPVPTHIESLKKFQKHTQRKLQRCPAACQGLFPIYKEKNKSATCLLRFPLGCAQV